MNKNEDFVKTAGIIFIALIVAPMVIGTAGNVILGTYCGITNTVNNIAFHRRMMKGLKKGTITKINGLYYEVESIIEEA